MKKKQSTIKTISKEIRKAEIYWALNKVYHHHSVRSASKESQLFPTMFPDSAIAKEFAMSHTKLGYLINHGIAPYFHVKIMDELLPKYASYSRWIFTSSILTKKLSMSVLTT